MLFASVPLLNQFHLVFEPQLDLFQPVLFVLVLRRNVRFGLNGLDLLLVFRMLLGQ